MTISGQTVNYSGITIEPTGTLVINNQSKVGMHDDGQILVKGGAKLIVDNSTLTTSTGCQTGTLWGGIRVGGSNASAQPAVYDANNNPLINVALNANQSGVVFLLNNSRVEKARNALSTNFAWNNWSGVVFAKNTDFIDNRRVAEFMQYPSPGSGATFTNTSKFIDCLFEGGAPGSIGVTIWDTDNITFNGCNFVKFENEGLVTYDAGTIVRGSNNFIDNWRAITNTATYPYGNFPLVVDGNNYFESSDRDFIHSYAGNRWAGLKIDHNEFFGGAGAIGIWVDGPSRYNIDNNALHGLTGGMYITNTGYKNDSKQNMVRCNEFQSNTWGIDFGGDNLFAQFLGNNFQTVGADVTNSGTIRNQQGGPGAPASNCFDNVGLSNADIVANGATFKYYRRGLGAQTCEIPVTLGNYTVTATNGNPINCANLPGTLGSVKEEDLPLLRQQVATLQAQFSQDPNNATKEAQYLDALYQKEMALGELIKIKMAAGDFVGAETLLDQENTLESDISLFGMKMNRGAYTEAQALLNTLPQATQDDIWFGQIQQINIQRLQNGATFQLSQTQENLLDQVADSQSPYRGYARAMLMLLKGKRYESDHPLIPRAAGQPETEKLLEPRAQDWLIAPNPANNVLQITFGKMTVPDAEIRMYDIFGCLSHKAKVGDLLQAQFDTGNLPEGVYMIVLTENGKISKQSKISIKH